MRAALYIGGPLDGQHAEKNTPGRWPIYRDDAGNPIPSAKGDREFCGFDPNPTRYYLHQIRAAGARIEDVYVHASAYQAWLKED